MHSSLAPASPSAACDPSVRQQSHPSGIQELYMQLTSQEVLVSGEGYSPPPTAAAISGSGMSAPPPGRIPLSLRIRRLRKPACLRGSDAVTGLASRHASPACAIAARAEPPGPRLSRMAGAVLWGKSAGPCVGGGSVRGHGEVAGQPGRRRVGHERARKWRRRRSGPQLASTRWPTVRGRVASSQDHFLCRGS
jgi:hypothetical protein